MVVWTTQSVANPKTVLAVVKCIVLCDGVATRLCDGTYPSTFKYETAAVPWINARRSVVYGKVAMKFLPKPTETPSCFGS